MPSASKTKLTHPTVPPLNPIISHETLPFKQIVNKPNNHFSTPHMSDTKHNDIGGMQWSGGIEFTNNSLPDHLFLLDKNAVEGDVALYGGTLTDGIIGHAKSFE